MIFTEFRFPQVYVQGRGALYEMKRYLYPHGERFLFVLGCEAVEDEVKARIDDSFSKTAMENIQETLPFYIGKHQGAAKYVDDNPKNFEYEYVSVEGKEVTRENIQALADRVKEYKPDYVIGIGGGKALDMARGQYHITGVEVALVPTQAATNAAGTRLNVIYNEDGSRMEGFGMTANFSKLILADTEILITAPARSVAAGIGDCLCTTYEGMLTGKQRNTREYASTFGWAGMERCEQVLRNQGIAAYRAAQAGVLTHDFNQVAEYLILANGMISGMIGSMNLGHVLDELLVYFEGPRKFPHGHAVGYAVLPMFVMEGRPLQDLYDYADFCMELGIPVNFEQLGLSGVTKQELIEAAEVAMESDVFKITPVKLVKEDLYGNMLVANEIISEYLAKK